MEQAKKRKQKLSLYIDFELIEKADDFIYHRKKQLPVHIKSKLNRTSLINFILAAILDEYEQSKEDSLLENIVSFRLNLE